MREGGLYRGRIKEGSKVGMRNLNFYEFFYAAFADV